MSRKLPFTVYTDGWYYARVAVPKDLKKVLQKTALYRPLSGDFRDAQQRLPGALAELRGIIADARQSRPPEAPQRPRPTKRTPRQAAHEFYTSELAEDEHARLFAQHDLDPIFRPALLAALTGVAQGSTTDKWEINDLVGWAIEIFSPGTKFDTPEWFDLARTLAGVKIETLKRAAERDRNDWTGTPRHPLLQVPENQGKPDPRFLKADSALDVEAIAERVIGEKQPSSGTANEYRVAARMLNEFLGGKRPVFRITADDALAYKDALLRTPSSYTKRFPGKTLPQAIEANTKSASPYPVLDRVTIRDKWLARTKSIFSFAVNNRLIPDNPFASVKVDEAKGAYKKKRTKFTPPELLALFSSADLRNDAEYQDEKFWALAIALYTGARASELAQLELDSVRREDGVLCFAIEEETKNEQSLRLVPVHKVLTELGLMRRVEKLRAGGASHLFPIWFKKGAESKQRAREHGKVEKQPFSQFIPRWLNRSLLPSLGIKDKTKVFHSFRYTLKSALENAEVGADVSDRITGHDDSSTGRGYVQYGLQTLEKAINKARFPEVEHLLLGPQDRRSEA